MTPGSDEEAEAAMEESEHEVAGGFSLILLKPFFLR